MWKEVQNNIGKFQNYFGGNNFIVIDNNDAGEDIFNEVWKKIMKEVKKPVENYVAKEWIKKELEAKKRT
jgi:hypothetical protein